MAYRDIRIIGDPVLRTECDWITDIDDSVKALVEDLLETVDEDGRAGLAANQIGVGLRAFSWNIDGEIGYILNPKIVELSKDEYQDGDEGCLSVPGLWFPTERAGTPGPRAPTWTARRSSSRGRSSWPAASSTSATTWRVTSTSTASTGRTGAAMKELRAQGL